MLTPRLNESSSSPSSRCVTSSRHWGEMTCRCIPRHAVGRQLCRLFSPTRGRFLSGRAHIWLWLVSATQCNSSERWRNSNSSPCWQTLNTRIALSLSSLPFPSQCFKKQSFLVPFWPVYVVQFEAWTEYGWFWRYAITIWAQPPPDCRHTGLTFSCMPAVAVLVIPAIGFN